MEKAQAITALGSITSSDFTAALRRRAEELINAPDGLNQGSFGVCGMASIVYVLLNHDLQKFIDLLKAVFDGRAFCGIEIPEKIIHASKGDVASGKNVLLFHRQKQLAHKDVALGGKLDQTFDLDFIVSRSLGKLLKMKSKALYERQVEFSDRFAEGYDENPKFFGTEQDHQRDMSHQIARNKGDLALTVEGIAFLMKEVIGAAEVGSNVYATFAKFSNRVDLANQAFASPKKQPFAFAMVNGSAEINAALLKLVADPTNTPRISAPPKPRPTVTGKKAPEFRHYVVITGSIAKSGTAYSVPLWTYQKRGTILFESTVAPQYFYGFVYGHLLA